MSIASFLESTETDLFQVMDSFPCFSNSFITTPDVNKDLYVETNTRPISQISKNALIQ